MVIIFTVGAASSQNDKDKEKAKDNIIFFFVWIQRSKYHTRSVFYEKIVHNLLRISY
jgi:hypothetical protein